MARTYPVMSRKQIEGLIADGRTITIIDQHVLKVDAWLKYHPGGDTAIMHMIGRDATDEVNAFVPPTTTHSEEPQVLANDALACADLRLLPDCIPLRPVR